MAFRNEKKNLKTRDIDLVPPKPKHLTGNKTHVGGDHSKLLHSLKLKRTDLVARHGLELDVNTKLRKSSLNFDPMDQKIGLLDKHSSQISSRSASRCSVSLSKRVSEEVGPSTSSPKSAAPTSLSKTNQHRKSSICPVPEFLKSRNESKLINADSKGQAIKKVHKTRHSIDSLTVSKKIPHPRETMPSSESQPGFCTSGDKGKKQSFSKRVGNISPKKVQALKTYLDNVALSDDTKNTSKSNYHDQHIGEQQTPDELKSLQSLVNPPTSSVSYPTLTLESNDTKPTARLSVSDMSSVEFSKSQSSVSLYTFPRRKELGSVQSGGYSGDRSRSATPHSKSAAKRMCSCRRNSVIGYRVPQEFDPQKTLQNSYLRLSKTNIETLEAMCLERGIQPGLHVNSQPSDYDPGVVDIFADLRDLNAADAACKTVEQQSPSTTT